MLASMNEAVALAKRETPKIGGSAAAFVALVTILVLIIVISCSAVVYLMLEDVSHDPESQNRNRPARYQLSAHPSDSTHHGSAQTYFRGILDKISGSRKSSSDIRKDKPGISRKSRGLGWLQAGSGSDWDSDSPDERQAARKPMSQSSYNSTAMTMQDSNSMSLVTLPTPNADADAFPPLFSRLSSPSSDAFDPHSIRGLSYADQLPTSSSLRTLVPSIPSQPHSPQSSQFSLSRSLNEPKPSEIATASPASLERISSPDPTDNDGDPPSADPPRPLIRTFESGSRFIEEL